MALNVPVAMLMSMVVAFTITPWLATRCSRASIRAHGRPRADADPTSKRSLTYRVYQAADGAAAELARRLAWAFLASIGALLGAAMGLPALGLVPLKMLPFDNKNELQLVARSADEGTTLERTDAAVQATWRTICATVPEVADVRQLRRHRLADGLQRPGAALLPAAGAAPRRHPRQPRGKNRRASSRATPSACALRDDLTADRRQARPGSRSSRCRRARRCSPRSWPRSTAGRTRYDDLRRRCGDTCRRPSSRGARRGRMSTTPSRPQRQRLRFVVDQEKAALNGVSDRARSPARSRRLGCSRRGEPTVGMAAHLTRERNPLAIVLRLPRRGTAPALEIWAGFGVKGRPARSCRCGAGPWELHRVDQTIYHKNLERVVYVFAETLAVRPSTAAP